MLKFGKKKESFKNNTEAHFLQPSRIPLSLNFKLFGSLGMHGITVVRNCNLSFL